jgi:hypothetical protein
MPRGQLTKEEMEVSSTEVEAKTSDRTDYLYLRSQSTCRPILEYGSG